MVPQPLFTLSDLTSYILSVAGGYLVGSIPVGYLLVRYRSRLDLRSSGSGNVGAFNAGVVTGSPSVGILVGVLDGLKGLLVTAVCWQIAGFWSAGAGLLAAVLGHNYPVWLRFKGGRGLATACGGFFPIGLAYTIVWCTVWAVVKKTGRTILAANLLAILATPVILVLLPGHALEAVMTSETAVGDFRILAGILSVVLYLRHHEGWKELQNSRVSPSGEHDKERTP